MIVWPPSTSCGPRSSVPPVTISTEVKPCFWILSRTSLCVSSSSSTMSLRFGCCALAALGTASARPSRNADIFRMHPPGIRYSNTAVSPGRAVSVAILLALLQIKRPPPPDVKYVPTPQGVVDAMLALARVTSDDIVYDLGSGDGRIPITAARVYGARGVGIEVDPFYLRMAYDNLKQSGVGDRVRFVNDTFFGAD